ncbi:MAG: hypothetical protein Q7R49_06310 [Candidatus Daviesbacteria bacterium]|nr:hypothetical protein [Candidatus Daviesbacteria bacterium]
MSSLVEIPTLKPPFSEHPLGVSLTACLAKLYALDASLFPLSASKTSALLSFETLKSGQESIEKWSSGILNIDTARLTRAEIGLLKLVQVIMAPKQTPFEEVRALLSQNLAGTYFEDMVGREEIRGKNQRGKVSLLFPDDPWYLALEVLTTRYNGVTRT